VSAGLDVYVDAALVVHETRAATHTLSHIGDIIDRATQIN
jgi:hypothetical protein